MNLIRRPKGMEPAANDPTVYEKPFLPPSKPSLIAALFLVLLILVISGLYAFERADIKRSVPTNQDQQPDLTIVQEIVGRGSVLLGQDKRPDSWIKQIGAGMTGLDDYLLRLFVSPAYLILQADDEHFLRDLYYVVTGGQLNRSTEHSFLDDALIRDNRLLMINAVLTQAGYDANLPVGASGSRLTSFSVNGELPQTGADVIGQMAVNMTAETTGPDVAFRLYVDGSIHQRTLLSEATAADTSSLIWDTETMSPGNYDLAVLGIGADGRGRWLPLDSFHVPIVQPLPAGSVRMASQTSWFRIEPWSDDTIRLNMLQASASLDASLFTAWNEKKADSSAGPQQPGALFFRPDLTKESNETYYVRIQSDQADLTTSIRYTLVSAPKSAHLTGNPDAILAVIDQSGDIVTVRDANGQKSNIGTDEIMLIDPESRLSRFQLNFADGQPTDMMPLFDRETDLYALYVTPQTERLNYQATTMEGSAAQLKISLIQDQQQPQSLDSSGDIQLQDSINTLTLTVTGFDQTERTYTLQVLRPPDQNGFHQTLDQFPQNWRTPVFWLHIQHPNYQFEAQQTNIDWTDFIDAQDERDRSLIDAGSVPASWVEPGSPVYDGSSWKAADRRVIAYYANPQNFLDPVNIFQFEKLTFLEDLHTHEGIEQILQGTFMEAGQSSLDYAAMILEAGQDADISPFFLASRIIQEMGRQAQSPLATGTLEGYEGVYNFYNIGSYPNPEVPNGAQINGARYALFGADPDQAEITEEEAAFLLPWTTPQRAITGGARWIARRYVAIGQDTLYGQKFDLIEEGGFFIHQYAQNIQMAWAEGRRTRNAWLELGLIDEAFVFRIPVFDNMPITPDQLP